MNRIGFFIVLNFSRVRNLKFEKSETAIELLGTFCLLRLYQQLRNETTIVTRGETMTIFSRLKTYPKVLECLNLNSITKLSTSE